MLQMCLARAVSSDRCISSDQLRYAGSIHFSHQQPQSLVELFHRMAGVCRTDELVNPMDSARKHHSVPWPLVLRYADVNLSASDYVLFQD